MTTRHDFYGFRLLIQELEQKNKLYDMLSEKIESPSGTNLSGMPRNQNPDNRTELLMNQRMNLGKKIDSLKLTISEERAKLDEAMKILNITQRTVLECRYFLLLEWEEINALLFGSFEDYKRNDDKYMKKTRKIQTLAFRKLEGKK